MNPWGHYQRFPNKRLQTWTSLRQWSLRTERNLAPGRYVQRRSSDEIVLRQFQTISCIINILGSVERHHEWRVRSCWISLVDSTEVCISPSETFYSLSLSLCLPIPHSLQKPIIFRTPSGRHRVEEITDGGTREQLAMAYVNTSCCWCSCLVAYAFSTSGWASRSARPATRCSTSTPTCTPSSRRTKAPFGLFNVLERTLTAN